MKDLRNINRILGFIPSIPILCILVIGLFGILTFGKLPAYGRNPDPSSLHIAWIQMFGIFPTFISIFSMPISIAIAIHLKLNKIRFRLSDLVSFAVMVSSVFIFFLLKYGAPEFFLWIMD